MGAWIEILLELFSWSSTFVAPYMGAWIEMDDLLDNISNEASRSLHGSVDWNSLSGLLPKFAFASLPTWERGLKYVFPYLKHFDCKSLPTWERGLKSRLVVYEVYPLLWSLPTWERGLKYFGIFIHFNPHHVAPYMGAWIEINITLSINPLSTASLPTWERGLKYTPLSFVADINVVAPYMGAWIEIFVCRMELPISSSLPTWERGLKFATPNAELITCASRSLHGSVDWNLNQRRARRKSHVAPYMGAWIEINYDQEACRVLKSLPTWERGLKSVCAVLLQWHKCRSLHGSVDWNHDNSEEALLK